jgi:hypothetical protein
MMVPENVQRIHKNHFSLEKVSILEVDPAVLKLFHKR